MGLEGRGLGKGYRRNMIFGGMLGVGVFGFMWVILCGLPIVGNVNAAETQVSLGVSTVLSLATTPESALNLPVTPTATGVHTTRKLTASVATNNLTGFTLTMSSGDSIDEGVTPGTSLVNLAGNSTNTLPSSTGTVTTPIVLANNTWGYGVPKTQTNSAGLLPEQTSGFDTTYTEVTSQASLATKFAQVPAIALPIKLKATTSQSTSDNTDVYFGTRVDTSKPAGSYRGTVILSLLANYVEPEYPLMQNFSASDCALMGVNETIILRDGRGNRQAYRVRKLADNKCWMIDDMKLGDTGQEIVLTSQDSDVTENFVLPPSAIRVTGSTAGQANRLNNGRCDSGSNSGTGSYLTCAGTTSGTSPVGNYNFAAYADPSGTTQCSTNTGGYGVVYSDESLSGCGYLYNWYTATAGKGTYDTQADTITNANAVTSSLCPAGWHLPMGGNGAANSSNEFAVLNGAMIGGGPSIENSATTSSNFRPSGSFSGSYSGNWLNKFDSQGAYGYYWSASAYSTTLARDIFFGYTDVYPGSEGDSKYNGTPVRCVMQ